MAATTFANRLETDAGIIATGQIAFADAARAFSNLADHLDDLRRDIERFEIEAGEQTGSKDKAVYDAKAADTQAAQARGRAELARAAATAADLAAPATAASHRQQEAAELNTARAAAEQASEHSRAASRHAAELHALQEKATRKVEDYKQLAADAAGTFQTIASLAPHVHTVFGTPVSTIDSPTGPGKTVPIIPKTAPPPEQKKDENAWDGFKESGAGLIRTGKTVRDAANFFRPNLGEFSHPQRMLDDRHRTVDGVWKTSKVIVQHPLETAKELTYRPYKNAFDEGGWDKAAAVLGTDAAVTLLTAGAGKGAQVTSRAGSAAAMAGRRAAWRVRPNIHTGDHVYRVWGADDIGVGPIQIDDATGYPYGSPPFGVSWTNKNPATMKNPRAEFGLPSVRPVINPGRFIIKAQIIDLQGIRRVPATPLHGHKGGASELEIPNAEQKLRVLSVEGINPEL